MIEIVNLEIAIRKKKQKKNHLGILRKRGAIKKVVQKYRLKKKDHDLEAQVVEDLDQGTENPEQNHEKENDLDQEVAENDLLPQEGGADQEVETERERRKVIKKIRRRSPKRETDDQDQNPEGLDLIQGDPQDLILKFQEIMMRRKKVLIQKRKNQKKTSNLLLIKDRQKNLIIWIYLIHHKLYFTTVRSI